MRKELRNVLITCDGELSPAMRRSLTIIQKHALIDDNLVNLFASIHTMKNLQEYRRNFLQSGVTGLFTAFFPTFTKAAIAQPSQNNKGILLHADEGEHILTGRRRIPITIKISKATHGVDNISFCTENMIPGRKMRVHKHLYHDELIFIHQGEGSFTLGNAVSDVEKGSVAFIPKGMWHGLENTGTETLIMTFGYSPAGFEGYFRENGTQEGTEAKGRTEDQYAATALKYGMVYQ
jgi:quercetin dioxygenase-like cupin family protein